MAVAKFSLPQTCLTMSKKNSLKTLQVKNFLTLNCGVAEWEKSNLVK